jgi:hypothetical protein
MLDLTVTLILNILCELLHLPIKLLNNLLITNRLWSLFNFGLFLMINDIFSLLNDKKHV